LSAAAALLGTLSPEATLARGYSITRDAEGNIVRFAAALAPGDTLRTRFRHGEAESVVR
jgi:exodeoxyribonuclease VII large subunit